LSRDVSDLSLMEFRGVHLRTDFELMNIGRSKSPKMSLYWLQI
jgi:hypothetical protein